MAVAKNEPKQGPFKTWKKCKETGKHKQEKLLKLYRNVKFFK